MALQQKNWLIRFYSEADLLNKKSESELESLRTVYINNTQRVKIEWVDYIPKYNQDSFIVGLYDEMFQRIRISRIWMIDSENGHMFTTTPVHELTHASHLGDYMITTHTHELIVELSAGSQPKDVYDYLNWEYLTSDAEILSRVSSARFYMDLYDFESDSWATFDEFEKRLDDAKKNNWNTVQLLKVFPDHRKLYRLITEVV